MSDDFENDNSDGENDNSGSGLRKQLEAFQQKARDAEARAAQAEASIAQRNLSDSLGDRGYETKVARKITKFISKDEVDLSDETAVNSWLEENADIFPTPGTQPGSDDEPDDNPHEGEAQAMGRIGQVQTHSQPATRTKFEQATGQLSEDASKEEVYKAYVDAGI